MSPSSSMPAFLHWSVSCAKGTPTQTIADPRQAGVCIPALLFAVYCLLSTVYCLLFEDFMFQLTGEEFNDLKSQFVTSSWGGMRRALPYAFTEQGIAMLSGVLKSPRSIQVNIEIMRAFVNLRQML